VILELMERMRDAHLQRDETATDGWRMRKDLLDRKPICMYMCMHANILSQLARHSVGLVLEVSVPQGRLMP
jgi:hypothetical protein